jgi:hypothetical protein
MFDIQKERAFPLVTAAKDPVLVAFNRGRRPASVSVWRYCKHGKRSADGNLVKLEHRLGSRGLLTSHEAIVRFVDAVAGAGKYSVPSSARSPRRRTMRDAERFCERQGA